MMRARVSRRGHEKALGAALWVCVTSSGAEPGWDRRSEGEEPAFQDAWAVWGEPRLAEMSALKGAQAWGAF